MKQRTAVLTALLTFFILLGCNEQKLEDKTEPVTSSSTDNAEHLLMYFKGLHPADQRAFFSGLPSVMRHALVKTHWQDQLDQAKNAEEKKFIQGLINSLKPEYYQDTALYKKEGAPFYDDQERKAFGIFGNDTARVVGLLYEIGGNENAARMIAEDAGGIPDCECNIKDDWCFRSDCLARTCKASLLGCGKGLIEKCNGLCISSGG